MGLTSSKKKFLSNDKIGKLALTNPTLEKLFNNFKNYDGYITESSFDLCIFLKKVDSKISHKLFKIFASEKDKMYLADLKYFYSAFISTSIEDKICLLTYLLFGEKTEKLYGKYHNRVNLLFAEELKIKLLHMTFLKSITAKSGKVILRDLFKISLETHYKDFLVSFEFLKTNLLSSLSSLGMKGDFLCNCYMDLNSRQNVNQTFIESLYERMEPEFRRMEKLNDGLFTIQMLEVLLNDININPKLVQVMISYVKRKTLRTFLDFKTFVQFLLQFRCNNVSDQTNLLYDLLSFPKDVVDKNVLESTIKSCSINARYPPEKMKLIDQVMNNALRSGNSSDSSDSDGDSDNDSDTISRSEFHELAKDNFFFSDIFNSMERVNCIPYLFFKIRPAEKIYEKNSIDILTKGEKNIEEYVKSQIQNETEFFGVNYDFWEKWCEYVEVNAAREEVSKPRINIDKIMCVYSGKIKPGLVYMKDFLVFPKKMYELFRGWYDMYGTGIPLKKIFYTVALPGGMSLENEIYHPGKKGILNISGRKGDTADIQEIELYPIFTKYFTMDEITKNITEPTIPEARSLLLQLFESKRNLSRLVAYSRKTKFSEIKCKLDKDYDVLRPETSALWVFYKDNLFYKPLDENTFEDEKIADFCLVVLDTHKDDQWITDILSGVKQTKPMEAIDSNTNRKHPPQNEVPMIPEKKEKRCFPYGLSNIGNTCYMNSILQILLNLKELKDIFLNPNFKNFINTKNKFGRKGKLIGEFLKFLEERWTPKDITSGKDNVFRPTALKEIAGEVNTQFKNFDQQDAQEFLNFLLDELHEEINLKNERNYFPNPEQGNNTEEELSNIYWANNLRRSTSFIHSLFLFQLKSNLICQNCGERKVTFETNTVISLSIPQKRTITLEVVLYRIPFVYKAYYSKINEDFERIAKENDEQNIRKCLSLIRMQSFEHENISLLTSSEEEESIRPEEKKEDSSSSVKEKEDLLYHSRLTASIPIKLILEIERKNKVGSIVDVLRGIKELELEPKASSEEKSNEMEYPQELTSYVIGTRSAFNYLMTFIDLNLKIDECFQNYQAIHVYELLNSNGIFKIINNCQTFLSLIYLPHFPEGIFDFINEETNAKSATATTTINSTSTSTTTIPGANLTTLPVIEDKILGVNTSALSYFNKPNAIERYLNNNPLVNMEYLVQIYHRYPIPSSEYLFRKTTFVKLDFLFDVLLVNNTKNSFNSKFLYDYIWEKYEHLLIEPSKIKNFLWWQSNDILQDGKGINNTTSTLSDTRQIKNCYPFVIKLLNQDTETCTSCPWYRFCTGCVLDPMKNESIHPNHVVMVEWCNLVVKKEMNENTKKLILNHESVKSKEEDKSAKTLSECFDLFLEQEILDEKLKCNSDTCRSFQKFSKKYDIDKLPPVLVVNLKRFKYAKMYRTKIDNLVDFPIKNLELNTNTKYDLYGIVNHYGYLSGGHYTSIIKIDGKWVRFDDSRINDNINECNIVSDGAYILFYIAQGENKMDYYQMMTSILQSFESHSIAKRFICSEPVITPYGNGYVKGVSGNSGNQIVNVKFLFGSGYIHERNVKKETVLQNSLKANERDIPSNKHKTLENLPAEGRGNSANNENDSLCIIY